MPNQPPSPAPLPNDGFDGPVADAALELYRVYTRQPAVKPEPPMLRSIATSPDFSAICVGAIAVAQRNADSETEEARIRALIDVVDKWEAQRTH